uniref:Uncharacterized protein n=1 Tax=Arundo donax TaxID=35708 RepID=A0A0A9CIT7_ARUDO
MISPNTARKLSPLQHTSQANQPVKTSEPLLIKGRNFSQQYEIRDQCSFARRDQSGSDDPSCNPFQSFWIVTNLNAGTTTRNA